MWDVQNASGNSILAKALAEGWIRQVCNFPQSKTFVGPDSPIFGASLIEKFQRWGKVERIKRQIDWPPVTRFDIPISCAARKRRRKEVCATAALNILQCSKDMFER
jgi:hypothetical protein